MAELAHAIPPGEDLTPSAEQVDAARLVVAGHTPTAAELRMLLDVLGLAEEPAPEPEPEHTGQPHPIPACGTSAAYHRHTRLGETPCEPCRAVKREQSREQRRKDGIGRRRLLPCGTPAAYERHRNRGEDPCEPCREAAATYNRRKKQRRKQRT